MQLINPIWLWGLTGLLIPIGIHLLSRKEGKVIKFGSLRYLEESHTKQSLNIRLNEISLLILRCLLILLVVMLLCGLNIDLFRSQKSQWLVLEDGLERDASIEVLIDSLKQQGAEIKSMKKGFPEVSNKQAEPFGSYWEMVSQLPLESLDKVIIVSYNFTSGFNGKRLSLPDNVTWISKEPVIKEFALSSVKFANDSVLIRMGKSSSLQTSFTNLTEGIATVDSVVPTPPDTLHLAIYADPEYEYDSRIVRASVLAIEKTIPVVFNVVSPSSSDKVTYGVDWMIWLSKKDPGILTTKSILLRDESNSGSLLLESVKTNPERWHITKRLNEEVALKEQFALNLSTILLNKTFIQHRADSLDQTTQPEELLWSKNKSQASSASLRITDSQSTPYLLFVTAALLIAERILASKRNA